VTTDSTETGLTTAAASYKPGSWFGVVGEHATVLLPPTEKARAGAIWALVDDGAGFDEVLDALVSDGLRTLPGFVLVAATEASVRVVVRGAAVASFETGDGAVEVEGSGAATWTERSLAGVTKMTVSLGEEQTGPAHTLVGGLVRLSGLEVPPPAPEVLAPPEQVAAEAAAAVTDGPTDTGEAHQEPSAEVGPAGPEQGVAEPAFAPSLSVVPPVPAAGPDAAELGADELGAGQPDADLGESDQAVTEAPEPEDAEEADHTPDPLTDPMTDSFSFATPLVDDETDASPEQEEPQGESGPEEQPPAAAEAAPPPPPPGFPPPNAPAPPMPPAPPAPAPPPAGAPATPPPPPWGTPPAPPTDDHDGLTRAGAPVPEMNSRPGIPGQPEAPKVTAFPVARLEFSSGDRVDVDRVVLVGRAPEAGRFTQSEQPLLVTVPSPHQEISSTHCEIRPGTGVDHGAAVVTDLGSTNGTVLVQPGLGPEDLRPGVPVQLIPGAVIDLGDGLTIRVTHP